MALAISMPVSMNVGSIDQLVAMVRAQYANHRRTHYCTVVLCASTASAASGIFGRAERAGINLRHRCIWRHRGIGMRDEAPPQAEGYADREV